MTGMLALQRSSIHRSNGHPWPTTRDAGNFHGHTEPYRYPVTGITIDVVEGEAALGDALPLRREVFVEEQGVPPERERDEYDDSATHLIARNDDRVVGTARLRSLDDTTAKVERVAVKQACRGQGLGQRLMAHAERIAAERAADTVVLHSQTSVEAFYQNLGYETTSDVFEDAGIPHVEMEKTVE